MKKIISVLLLLVGSVVFANDTIWHGLATMACPRCYELTTKYRRGYSYCLGCPMWRRVDLEIGQHEYAIFKCKHGHTIHYSYKTGEWIKK